MHASPDLRRLDSIIWILLAGIIALDSAGALLLNFSIDWASFVTPFSVGLTLRLGACYYYGRRRNADIGSALESTSQVIVFAAVAAPLSYLAASAALPLQDATFDQIDRAVGFDWVSFLSFLRGRPILFQVARTAYLSMGLQIAVVILVLGFAGRLATLRTFMLAFILGTLTIIAISAVLPAESAWPHYAHRLDPEFQPVSHTSLAVFRGLRDGSVRTLMADGAEGIITFPSLHAAAAVLLLIAAWPVRVFRWLGASASIIMLAATPIDGSHYGADVLAGVAIAILGWGAARSIMYRVGAPKEEGAVSTQPAQSAIRNAPQ